MEKINEKKREREKGRNRAGERKRVGEKEEERVIKRVK